MEPLKLTLEGIEYLKSEHGVDLIKGSNIDFNNADIIAALFVAGSRNWKTPTSFEEVRTNYDAFEIFEAVGSLLENMPGKPAAKKVAKKRARRKS